LPASGRTMLLGQRPQPAARRRRRASAARMLSLLGGMRGGEGGRTSEGQERQDIWRSRQRHKQNSLSRMFMLMQWILRRFQRDRAGETGHRRRRASEVKSAQVGTASDEASRARRGAHAEG